MDSGYIGIEPGGLAGESGGGKRGVTPGFFAGTAEGMVELFPA